ncbi:MAG: HEPN domain-containing protein [Deltaproteobacteria bacterium]|nr:HEPN domain-containing protein [Deltaproteobacteria bacterium]
MKRVRHGLFFAHLALEKMLKAHVCSKTNALAPPIHNLVIPAQKSGIEFERIQLKLIAKVNEFNIEGRYPDLRLPLPDSDEAGEYMSRIRELITWLRIQLDQP